jgi:hypothetical protein
MAPASSASSISLVKSPLPPASASGRSWIMSPVVRMTLISIRSPASTPAAAGETALHLARLHQRKRRAARADAQKIAADCGDLQVLGRPLCHGGV